MIFLLLCLVSGYDQYPYANQANFTYGGTNNHNNNGGITTISPNGSTCSSSRSYDNPPDYNVVIGEVRAFLPVPDTHDTSNWHNLDPDEVLEELTAEMKRIYDIRELLFNEPVMRDIERQLMHSIVDQHWIRHLTDLNHLRQGIGLRAVAQQDPLVAYKKEASGLWGALIADIEDSVARKIFAVQPRIVQQKDEQREMQTNRTDSGSTEEAKEAPRQTTVRHKGPKLKRNDPCHCGSGKKYKQCCLIKDKQKAAKTRSRKRQKVAS